MKSLDKALDILEFILNQNGDAVTPSAVARACGINAVTSVRILGALTRRDYLQKVSRHAGYAPGPTLYALADRRSFYGCVSHGAADVLKELAIQFDIQVNISVLQGDKRYLLYHYAAAREYPIDRKTSYSDDFYYQGTGRVLMSYADKSTVDRIVENLGLPGALWPEVKSRRDLDLHLARIRKAGESSFDLMGRCNIPCRVFGTAIVVPGEPVCALGTRINANRDTSQISNAMKAAAEAIKENILSQRKSF